MLHGVGHVKSFTVDSRLPKRPVHDSSSRTDKRPAGDIFVISRLFTHQHDRCVRRSLAKHSLCRAFVEMARRAAKCGGAEIGKIPMLGRLCRTRVFLVSFLVISSHHPLTMNRNGATHCFSLTT